MKESIDTPQTDLRPSSNYKKWAFRMLIYTVLTNLAIAYLVGTSRDFGYLRFNVPVLILLSILFFIAGVVLIVASHIYQEKRDYQYHISLWGFMLLVVLNIVVQFLSK